MNSPQGHANALLLSASPLWSPGRELLGCVLTLTDITDRKQLEEQLLEFPKGTHDDIIDALAYQINFWNGTKEAEVKQQAPEGSYQWWKGKIHRKPLVIGKLFGDLKKF